MAKGQMIEVENRKRYTVDLGTFNITYFNTGGAVDRTQLAISMAISVKNDVKPEDRKRLLDQKAWIGQLLDEVVGSMPLDNLHPTSRNGLKDRLKANINQRLGEDLAQEVILRIQMFGP